MARVLLYIACAQKKVLLGGGNFGNLYTDNEARRCITIRIITIRSRKSGYITTTIIQHSLAAEARTEHATTTITRIPRFPRGVLFARNICATAGAI